MPSLMIIAKAVSDSESLEWMLDLFKHAKFYCFHASLSLSLGVISRSLHIFFFFSKTEMTASGQGKK